MALSDSELTNRPRTAAVLGVLPAHIIKASGQSYCKHEQDTDRCDRNSTSIEGRRGKGLCPKSSTPLGGFAGEVYAWLEYVDPKREAGKFIQRITKETLRATEA